MEVFLSLLADWLLVIVTLGYKRRNASRIDMGDAGFTNDDPATG
jgi:hypothetical protein